jgi:O-antigen ligase/polysaccharide polymerase Wzy-like membrane protein
MALLLAAVIGLMALLITPGWLFYFDVTPKIAILLAGAAVAVFAAGRAPRWFTWLLLLSICSLGVSSGLSDQPALSAFGTNWRRFGVLTQGSALLLAWVVARQIAGHPGRLRTILRGVTIAAALSALYGIGQYFHWDPLLPPASYHVGEGIWTIVRPPGTLGYVSYFATWLAVTAYLAAALIALESSAAWRSIASATVALTVLGVICTGTRAAYIGLLAGIIVWLIYRRFQTTPRMKVAAAILLAAGVAFYFSPAGWPLRSRTRWFIEDPRGGARLLLWRDSLRMAGPRWALGYGPETFSASFPPFESKELARAYPDFVHESPHNIFLDALIAQGIPGVLLLGGWCLAGFLAAWRAGLPWLAAALAAGIVSQQFTVFTAPTAVVVYVTIALAIGGLREGESNPRAGQGIRPAIRLPAAILFVAPFLYCAARLIVADHALARASRSIESGDVRTAAAYYRQYTRWRFPGTSADLWYSRALMDLAQKSPDPSTRFQALLENHTAALRATETSEDRASAWYSLATVYASREDAAGAERALRSAIAARPNWFKSHWILAQLLRLDGRITEAEREAVVAADLNGGKNPEVVRTLAEIQAQRSSPDQKPPNPR